MRDAIRPCVRDSSRADGEGRATRPCARDGSPAAPHLHARLPRHAAGHRRGRRRRWCPHWLGPPPTLAPTLALIPVLTCAGAGVAARNMAAVAASAVANKQFLMGASLISSVDRACHCAHGLPERKFESNGFCSRGTSMVALDKSQRDVHRLFMREAHPVRLAGVPLAAPVPEPDQLLGKQAPLEAMIDFQ
jgi:hypothetical protein